MMTSSYFWCVFCFFCGAYMPCTAKQTGTYSIQVLLDIDSSHSLFDITGSIPPDLQHTIRNRGHHQEGPETLSPSKLADPRIVFQRRQHKWGERGGLHARLKACASRPPLPSLLLANLQSLQNKLDELRARNTAHWEISECYALIFPESWLSDKITDCAVLLQTHSVNRGDWTTASGKANGGGVCVCVCVYQQLMV